MVPLNSVASHRSLESLYPFWGRKPPTSQEMLYIEKMPPYQTKFGGSRIVVTDDKGDHETLNYIHQSRLAT